MEKQFFTVFTEDELRQLITECVRAEVQKLRETPNPGEDLIKVEQACSMLRVSRQTLASWAADADKKIKKYRIGRRTYYRRSEILAELES